MDTGEGRFEQVRDLEDFFQKQKQYPKSKGIFKVGETIEIRRSLFKVTKIDQFGIRLRLLKG